MSGHRLERVVQQLRGLVRPPEDGLADSQLLSRWLSERDQAAFELIVWRHGPAVLGVCQRLLARSQDVEDAFQATFLVFLRKAHTIGKHASIGSWLYKVAYRVALQARSRSARETLLDGRDVLVPAPDTADTAAWREVRLVLDEEVTRLPERYRAAFVLCCLQGKTNADAARELGVPTGTVLSRLSRARERLRVRLTRRGVTLTAGALASGIAADASASVPAPLVVSTIRAVLLGASEQAVAAGAISAQTAVLTKGALHAMWLTKLQTTTAAVLIAILVGGGSVTVYQTLAAGPDDPTAKLTKAQEAPDRPAEKIKTRKVAKQRTQVDPLVDQVMRALAQEEIKRLEARVKSLESKLINFESLTNTYSLPGKKANQLTTTILVPDAPAVTPFGSGAVSPSTVEDAESEVGILKAQLDAKVGALQGAQIEYETAQRSADYVKKLVSSSAVSESEALAANAKAARAAAGIRVKEAEVAEQKIRLAQAQRRLSRLRQLGGSSSTATETPRQQEIRQIRADLKRLQQRLDALEKSGAR